MMERFYRTLVRYPRQVTLLFVLSAIVSLMCWPLVDVNYDMNDYLPPESASTLALDTLEAEYEGGIPNARVMVRDVSLPQALEIAFNAGRVSISMLQRKLAIGYARAGRLVDELANRGVVSQAEGAKPRTVIMTRDEYNALYGKDGE